ncbi:tyrosine-type recombinase/integrase [Streptomyces yunnanensis]|uniref:Tyrosine-type recombinase/integrase n=1 Tax=Streptomyces yunnanensis TaxID=156453 RepID=A0ABY8A218_9ACTN|nr:MULTISPECIES: tyrosine-type recombinase/integrase [Streptomyces]WEB38734.1 tyrosine-type recombinase/integrase [Streptomyces yunnanensis]
MASKTLARGMGTFFKDCEHPESRWSKCPHAYKIRYRNAAGKQTEESGFATQTLAIERLTEIYKQKKSTPATKLERIQRYGQMRFEDFANDHLQRQRDLSDYTSGQVQHLLDTHLYPELGSRRMNSFDSTVVEGFIRAMERAGVGVATQRNAYIRLKAALLDAHKMGILEENPCEGVVSPDYRPKRIVIPSPELVSEIHSLNGDAFSLFVDMMGGCGLRNAEALAVNINNIVADDVYRVTEQLHRKTNKLSPLKHRKPGEFRETPLPLYVKKAILAYAEKHGTTEDGYLMRVREGSDKLLTITAIQNQWSRHKHELKQELPEGFTLYALRHWFASRCLTRGIPITDVATWMGHRNINVTFQTYSHLMPGSIGRAAKILDEGIDLAA